MYPELIQDFGRVINVDSVFLYVNNIGLFEIPDQGPE
jgi:hypothetical protein